MQAVAWQKGGRSPGQRGGTQDAVLGASLGRALPGTVGSNRALNADPFCLSLQPCK